MSNRKWRKGPPPYIGWWNASLGRSDEAWRWWDGKCWSFSSYPDSSADYINRVVSMKSLMSQAVEWTNYWPENARVERKNPNARA